jgi:hypothetical protein
MKNRIRLAYNTLYLDEDMFFKNNPDDPGVIVNYVKINLF